MYHTVCSTGTDIFRLLCYMVLLEVLDLWLVKHLKQHWEILEFIKEIAYESALFQATEKFLKYTKIH